MRRSLLHCESGSSLIEMALAAPLLAALVIGMIDLSNGYSTKLQLEQAAQRTIEKVAQQRSSNNSTLQTEAAEAAGVSTSAVTVDEWLECNGVRQSTTDATCPEGQTYARYVTVDIVKTYVPMFSTSYAGANADGTYTLHGKAGVRVQ